MLNPTKLANAATVVSVICHLLYLISILMAPRLVYTYITSMTPGYDFSVIETGGRISLGQALLGVLFMAVSVWVFVYLTAWLYNRWTKE